MPTLTASSNSTWIPYLEMYELSPCMYFFLPLHVIFPAILKRPYPINAFFKLKLLIMSCWISVLFIIILLNFLEGHTFFRSIYEFLLWHLLLPWELNECLSSNRTTEKNVGSFWFFKRRQEAEEGTHEPMSRSKNSLSLFCFKFITFLYFIIVSL